MRKALLLATALLASLFIGAGCQPTGDTGEFVHYGYTGSLPAKCGSCEGI